MDAQDEAIAPILRKFRAAYSAEGKLILETSDPLLPSALEAQANFLNIPTALQEVTIEIHGPTGCKTLIPKR